MIKSRDLMWDTTPGTCPPIPVSIGLTRVGTGNLNPEFQQHDLTPLWERASLVAPAGGQAIRVNRLLGPGGEPLQAFGAADQFPGTKQPLLFVVAGPVANIERDVSAFYRSSRPDTGSARSGCCWRCGCRCVSGCVPKTIQQALGDIRLGKGSACRRLIRLRSQTGCENLTVWLTITAHRLNGLEHRWGIYPCAEEPLTVIRNKPRP